MKKKGIPTEEIKEEVEGMVNSSIPEKPHFGVKISPSVAVLSFLLFCSVLAGGYFYREYRNISKVSDTHEVEKLVEAVGSLMVLPESEVPTIATVTDREKLSNQPFFQKAENGDKVLLYANSGKAVLYRPSIKKVIDVSIINVIDNKGTTSEGGQVAGMQTEESESGNEVQPTADVSEEIISESNETINEAIVLAGVIVSNGAGKQGLAKRYGDELAVKYGSELSVKESITAEGQYEKTIVVDVSGAFPELATKIAGEYGAALDTLPDGEPKPEGDILVILGKDRL